MKKLFSILLAICIMVGMVTVMASADTDNKALITMPVISGAKPSQERITINKGASDIWWLTTEDGYLTTEGASASNYNVKLSYPRDGTPTLYLNSANIFSPASGSGQTGAIVIGRITDNANTTVKDFDFIIHVEKDSKIKGTWSSYDGTPQKSTHGTGGIWATNSGTLTITGSGKLDVFTDDKRAIWKEGAGDLIFKDANIEAEVNTPQSWGSRFDTIFSEESNIIFDNTKAELANNLYGCIHARNGDIAIKNSSDLNLFAASDKSSCINMNAAGSYALDDSKLFIDSNGASAINKNTFNMTGVNAKGGTKEANAKAFSAKRQDSYTYLIAGPDVVIETEPEETTPPATTKPAATKVTKATTAATKPAGSAAATKPAGNATGDAANNATTSENATTPVDNNTTGEKKGVAQLWLYIILGIVILASVVVLVYVFVFVKKEDAVTEEVTEEPEATEDAE